MLKGFERLKSNKESFFRLYRNFVDYAINQLTDSAFKLWISLLASAHDFEGDSKGQVEVTVSGIKERFGWSRGKASYTLSDLLKKKFAKRVKRGLYHLPQTLQEVQSIEHTESENSQSIEQKVQSTEHLVQSDESPRRNPLSYKDDLSFTSSGLSEDDEDLGKQIEEIFGADFKEDK